MNDKTKTLQWKTSYQPYGQTLNTSGSATQNVRLPGQYADASFGNFHNGHREYMPITTTNPLFDHYAQADPIGLNGGMNPYAYVRGNPLSFTDPYGLCAISNDPNDKCDKLLKEMQDDIKSVRGSNPSDPKGLEQRFNQLAKYRDRDVYEGHKIQFEGRQRNLQKKIRDYIDSGCGDPGALIIEWANKSSPSFAGGLSDSETTGLKILGGTEALYWSYRAVRLLPSLYPPLWGTMPENLSIP